MCNIVNNPDTRTTIEHTINIYIYIIIIFIYLNHKYIYIEYNTNIGYKWTPQ